MITLSLARMLVGVTDRRPSVAPDILPATQEPVRGFTRLLPAALRRRLAERAGERELALAVRRLDELSPHLLDDIGMAGGVLADLADVPPVPAHPLRRPLHIQTPARPAVSRPDAAAMPAAAAPV